MPRGISRRGPGDWGETRPIQTGTHAAATVVLEALLALGRAFPLLIGG